MPLIVQPRICKTTTQARAMMPGQLPLPRFPSQPGTTLVAQHLGGQSPGLHIGPPATPDAADATQLRRDWHAFCVAFYEWQMAHPQFGHTHDTVPAPTFERWEALGRPTAMARAPDSPSYHAQR